MSRRSLLLGFGAGMLFAGGYLLVYPADESPRPLTQQELQAAAQTYDLVVLTKEEYQQLQQNSAQAGEQSPAAKSDDKPPAETSSATGEKATGEEPVSEHLQPLPAAPKQASTPKAQTPASPSAPNSKTPSSPAQPTASVKQPAASAKQPVAPTPAQPSAAVSASKENSDKSVVPAVPASPEVEQPGQPTVSEPTVEVRIPGGYSTNQVGQLLHKAGLVADVNGFVAEMKAEQKVDRIRAGTYQLSKNLTMDQLIKLITTPPTE
ncbi:endolytic transglycosylase MltG [Brevibacillus fulvus]|uniref:Chemotaxis protein histidine kinase CheA n=1 Tax=Brevibacillus fulvus TaxID=1125967 RepID=A0A939BSD7_9BACL|nr:endolytic transglycosylase MltG [Brevibacillus fulvus]MBM7590597.1 chemotaxis protein histidine kinase CheA [Brevibacillus fulvus]